MSKYKETVAELSRVKPKAYKHRNKVLRDMIIKTVIIFVISVAAPCIALKSQPLIMVQLAIVLGIVCPLAIVRPRKFLHKNFAGDIVSIEPCLKSVGVRAKNHYGNIYVDAPYINITVDDGVKKHSFKMPQEYGRVYRVGDRVLSTSGIIFPLVLTPRENDICACCGNMVPESKGECFVCGFINE